MKRGEGERAKFEAFEVGCGDRSEGVRFCDFLECVDLRYYPARNLSSALSFITRHMSMSIQRGRKDVLRDHPEFMNIHQRVQSNPFASLDHARSWIDNSVQIRWSRIEERRQIGHFVQIFEEDTCEFIESVRCAMEEEEGDDAPTKGIQPICCVDFPLSETVEAPNADSSTSTSIALRKHLNYPTSSASRYDEERKGRTLS